MRRALLALIAAGTPLGAAELPARAHQYLPTLVNEQRARWPDHPRPETLAAQIEQETCPSLTHKMCWNPRAELKTAREQGIGLGQITRTAKFDNLAEARKLDPSLAAWTWDAPYNATFQVRAMVLDDRRLYRLVKESANDGEHLAFAYAAYNGGLGGVLSDRRVCAATRTFRCDPRRWFGHTEHTSLKAKAPAVGYSVSFFQVNRAYVTNILRTRPDKYRPYFSTP